jgi:hypothetical protein
LNLPRRSATWMAARTNPTTQKIRKTSSTSSIL